jgi:hypothetical protein
MNTLSQFENMLNKTQNRLFEEKRDGLETIYDKYTKEGDSSEADYRSFTVTKLGQMGYTPLGGSNHRDTYAAGSTRVTTFKKFTTSVILPEELIEDAEKNSRVKKDSAKLFQRIPEDMVESANWTREVITADYIARGNSSTATNTWPGTFRDGLALASTSHVTTKGTVVTWSNLQTGSDMTQLALLEGLTLLANVPTEEGRPQGSVGDVYLVYGRAKMFRVKELLGTDKEVGTANNTINPLKGKNEGFGRIIPVLNPYLSNTFSGWALIDSKNHELLRFEKKAPTMSQDIDVNTGNRIKRCVMRYAIDADSAKGYVLNPGL